MDIQKVRQAFELIRKAWQTSKALHEKANICRQNAIGSAIRYDKDNIQTSPRDTQAEWLNEAADLDREAAQVLAIAESARESTYQWMRAVCKENEQYVLLQYYFAGKSYNAIKDEYIMMFDYGSKTTMYDVAQRGIRRIAEKL